MTKITAFLLISSGLALRGRAGTWMRGGAGGPSPRMGLACPATGFLSQGSSGRLLISSCETHINTNCIVTSESEIP